MPPPSGSGREPEPDGESYGAVLLRRRDGDDHRGAIDDALSGIRFSGWIAPAQDRWTVVLGRPGAGVVADGRRGIVEVGALLAERTGAGVLAVRVLYDRQLGLVAWQGADELARYCSDPSQEPDSDREVLSDPIGAEEAPVFAALCDRPEVAEELEEILEEELDSESVFESERLVGVLRLLGLPSWLVAAASLPKDVPTGPRAAEFTRLGAGRGGAAGIAQGMVAKRLRQGRTPPPIIADPPRSTLSGMEPWMF